MIIAAHKTMKMWDEFLQGKKFDLYTKGLEGLSHTKCVSFISKPEFKVPRDEACYGGVRV